MSITIESEDTTVQTNNASTPNRRIRAALVLTPLAIVMAAGLTGCGSNKSLTRIPGNEFSPESKAQLATVTIDPERASGEFTPEKYVAEGDSFQLPQQWVSEARQSAAELQAQRANAQSFEVYADSKYIESMAGADAQLQNGFVKRDTGYADAQRAKAIHNARIDQMGNQIQAREVAANAKYERQEAFLTASVKEWQAEIERMRSSAEKEWAAALAEHDRMMASYTAVNDRGQAEIDQMVKTADLTEQRAIEKVQSLRTQAKTVADQSAAEVSKLNQLIKTTTEQTSATYAELTQRAQSLDSQMSSQIADLDAQANQFMTSDADANYKVEIESAQTAYETAIAEAQDIKLSAQQRTTQDKAQIARMTADANAKLASAKTTYEEAQQWVTTQFAKSMADVENLQAQADRQENIARSAFIKAETDARVKALKAKAEHNKALAQAELEQIKAQAQAEAKSLQAKFAKEFSEQARKGSFVIPSNTKELNPGVSAGDKTPDLAKSDDKPVNVDVDRVADYKIGLAKAAQLRQEAEANRMEAVAHRDSEMGKFNDWWSGKQADYHATIASITAFEQKSNADVSRMLTKADSMIASAETEHNRALIDAESGRTEILATVETLKGNSTTLNKKKDAQVKQLLAQAEATKRIGESKVAALKVQRDSAQRRGAAKSAQLLAEAASLEQSQRAVVAQMREEINGAHQILDAELARLNQATDSFIAIAKANYNEGIAMADAFERIAVANTSELTARHIASKKQSDADLEYMQHLASAGELKRDAEVTRMFAQADESLGQAKAQDIASRGQIEADHQVAMASAAREFEVADARETGIRARFDHRVAMTEADRNRAYADLYAKSQQQQARTEMAQAQAATYSELSLAALERLNTTSHAFQLTAQRNWDSRLAMPSSLPAPANVDDLYENSKKTFDFESFANVPTDTE